MRIEDYKRIAGYTKNQVKSDKLKEKELREAYYELFREPLSITCDNCITDGIFRIQYHLKTLKQKVMETSKCDFKLKPGLVVYLPGSSLHLTNDNLTNELAFMLLKKTRKNIAYFASYPADKVTEFFGNPIEVKEEKPVEVKEVEPVVVEEKNDEETNQLDTLMAENSKNDLIKKLGDYPHDKAWTKFRLAEQLLKKLSEENPE